jgi:hypothetical protein
MNLTFGYAQFGSQYLWVYGAKKQRCRYYHTAAELHLTTRKQIQYYIRPTDTRGCGKLACWRMFDRVIEHDIPEVRISQN